MTSKFTKLLYRHRWGQARINLFTERELLRVTKDYSKCDPPGALILWTLVTGS